MPVQVKVGAPLKAILDATPKTSPLILVSTTNKPWTGGGFRASWRIAQKAAGVVGVTFHDLRGTAVTRLALVGCTEAEIAAITGHSLRDVRDQSSTRTTCTATRHWPTLASPSSKAGRRNGPWVLARFPISGPFWIWEWPVLGYPQMERFGT